MNSDWWEIVGMLLMAAITGLVLVLDWSAFSDDQDKE